MVNNFKITHHSKKVAIKQCEEMSLSLRVKRGSLNVSCSGA